MRVLVTGGAGFIGCNYIRYHLDKHPDDEIVVLDKLTYAGRLENLQDVQDQITFIRGDICNRLHVGNAMRGCDRVIHFAAESHVDRSIEDAGVFITTDVYGTFILLEAARKFGVQKFVQISTDEVYGQLLEGSSKETDELKPRNPYAASKVGADRLAYSYFTTHGVPVVITRSSNNYGPYQFPEKLVPRFSAYLLAGKKVPLHGDGKNIRDWLNVMDNCEAIDLCAEKGKLGEVYNIGGECEKTNLEITKLILETLGYGEDKIEYVTDRKGNDLRYSLDCSKIKSELGWTPKSDFDVAMRDTINWYKDNEWWWQPLLGK